MVTVRVDHRPPGRIDRRTRVDSPPSISTRTRSQPVSASVNSASTVCTETDFRCNDGKCIRAEWRCDGSGDCSDGEDEKDCPHPGCKADQWQCDKYEWHSVSCIAEYQRCDNITDCADGSDEKDCHGRTDFCEYVRRSSDGASNDCRDLRTPVPTTIPPVSNTNSGVPINHNVCRNRGYVMAPKTAPTAPMNQKPAVEFKKCSASEFQCKNKRCQPRKFKCDYYDDCGDNSDEEDCGEYRCPPGKWHCNGTGHCIDELRLCDGVKDCEDGADELSCSQNLCPSLGCQAGCHASPHGGVCTCPNGYKLDERFHRTCSGENLTVCL
ncbi:Low-density lipoprotein receptor domain class A [Ostertagia ostertagi]